MDKIKREEDVKNGLRLLDIVSSEKILSDDPDKVIYEDELLRFSPGLKQQYYPRWAQITKREFRCFKDRVASAEWLARPLISLPLHKIAKVERVSVKIGKERKTKNSQNPFQFEIFMLDSCGAETRPKVVEEENKSSRNPSIIPQLKKSALTGVPQKDKNSYMEYVKSRGNALSRVAVQQHIEKQGQSAWIPALSGADTWSSREKIWKTVQARHVFALAEKAECEKWVFVLNWVIDVVKDGSK